MEDKFSSDESAANGAPDNQKQSLSEQHFAIVPNVLINEVANGSLRAVDVVVYIALLDHLGENSCVWASWGTIARLTGYCTKSVWRSVNRLADRGHVRRGGRSSYRTVKLVLLTRVKDSIVQRGKPLPPVAKKNKSRTRESDTNGPASPQG